MTRNEAKKIVKKYTDKLVAANFPFESMYLFGSYATGKADKWSDIDVAVVGNSRKKYWDIITLLNKATLDVDVRIEPHYFKLSDFENEGGVIVAEIHKTGVKIV